MNFLKLCISSLALSQAKNIEVDGRSEALKLQQEAPATTLLQENKIQDLSLSAVPQISDIGLIAEALPSASKPSTSSWGLVRPGQSVPFEKNPALQCFGVVLIAFLISFSNAAGLSGAGSNIPFMLICFQIDMKEAVPLSAFVAVSATVLRFVLNFNQRHPTQPERNTINYEVVLITLPAVFLGSLIGVSLNQLTSELFQKSIFAVTVLWSTLTTFQKARALIAKEAGATPEVAEGYRSMEPTKAEDDESAPLIQAQTPELEAIMNEERSHFTPSRLLFLLIAFVSLFTCQYLRKSPSLSQTQKYTTVAAFVVIVVLQTVYAVNKVNYIQTIKKRDGYNFDANDLQFKSSLEIIALAFVCMVAAALCGLTGIAGGMVLGPLFLTYNMVPQVMSGTNQYITMIASIVVALQFWLLGQLNLAFAILLGGVTLISAYAGIAGVNAYVKRTGKQSTILVILTVVLTIALFMMPLDSFLKSAALPAAAPKLAAMKVLFQKGFAAKHRLDTGLMNGL